MNTPSDFFAVMGFGGGEIILIMILLLFFAVVVGGLIGLIYFIIRVASRPPAVAPPALPPQIVIQNLQKRDRDHLNLLSIFHFVFGGLALAGIAFLCLHYFMMHAVFSNPNMWKGQKGQTPPPGELFDIMIWFYLFMGLVMVAGLVLNVASGLFIRQRKHRVFSFIVAGLDCVQVPFGTVLGIFTILVLSRESVRELYADNASRGLG